MLRNRGLRKGDLTNKEREKNFHIYAFTSIDTSFLILIILKRWYWEDVGVIDAISFDSIIACLRLGCGSQVVTSSYKNAILVNKTHH